MSWAVHGKLPKDNQQQRGETMKHPLLTLTALAIAAGTVPPAQAQTTGTKESQSAAAPKGQVKDPVCGMMIDPKTAAGKSEHQGKTYYFCSREEKEKFDRSPETYVKPTKKGKTTE
jgi:YHS domain-containing protein